MFGSKNKNLGQTEEPPLPSPTGIRAQGPWDRSERSVESTAAFLDFGSILVRPISGMEIQVASNDSTNLAVLVSLGNSAVELRVAAASKHVATKHVSHQCNGRILTFFLYFVNATSCSEY